jgi:hypothetical protein
MMCHWPGGCPLGPQFPLCKVDLDPLSLAPPSPIPPGSNGACSHGPSLTRHTPEARAGPVEEVGRRRAGLPHPLPTGPGLPAALWPWGPPVTQASRNRLGLVRKIPTPRPGSLPACPLSITVPAHCGIHLLIHVACTSDRVPLPPDSPPWHHVLMPGVPAPSLPWSGPGSSAKANISLL